MYFSQVTTNILVTHCVPSFTSLSLLNCQVHSRGKALAKDVDFEKIARRTPGFTGADLQNLMNEAAILAARCALKEISKDEISDALERIIAGPEKCCGLRREEAPSCLPW